MQNLRGNDNNAAKILHTLRVIYALSVSPGQLSVRKGEAGRFSLLYKLQIGLSAQPYRTAAGLGLAVAAELIRGMKGRIEVQSVTGEGATFKVVLPAWDDGGIAEIEALADLDL